MLRTIISAAVVAVLASVASAGQVLSFEPSGKPVGSATLFNAVGTFNVGNSKARLEAAGKTTVQGGNPGNGWYSGTPRPTRSWEVAWNATTGVVDFKVFASSDWTGLAAMSMSQTPVLTSGNALIGLAVGGRLTSDTMSLVIDNVQFKSGAGSFVDVNSAEGSYSGNVFVEKYHALSGAPADFILRGTAQFPTGTTTGDSMRFFVTGVQGEAPVIIPLPAAAWAGIALLGVGGAVRRRVISA
jgi:hypothetical protein